MKRIVPIASIMAAATIAALPAVSLAAVQAATTTSATTTAAATSTTTTTSTSANTNMTASTKAATQAANQQQHLQTIQSKGAQEITRRITSLNNVSGKIAQATKLTASDKSYLTSEVSSELSGLQALQTKLAADTTVAEAHTDATSIYTGYRIYALLLPKISLIKTADDQQVAEAKLTALATKLQTRLTNLKAAGKDVSTEQAALQDMNEQLTASTAASSSIESSVIGLQPTDYDTNHALLFGDADKLKAARAADQQATTDARNIIAGIKQLDGSTTSTTGSAAGSATATTN